MIRFLFYFTFAFLSATKIFSQSGVIDSTFGIDGFTIIDISGIDESDFCNDIFVLEDGKILVTGNSTYELYVGFDVYVAKFNAHGSIDTSFGENGIFKAHFTNPTYFGEVIEVQSDNKIIVAGRSYRTTGLPELFILRLTEKGMLDTTFNEIGYIEFPDPDIFTFFKDVKILNDGRILAAGSYHEAYSDDHALLMMFLSNGKLDSSFAGDGIYYDAAILSNDNTFGVNVLEDEKILFGGRSYQSKYDLFAFKLNEDGSTDSTYGMNGLKLIDFQHPGSSDEYLYSMHIQDDGKLLFSAVTDLSGSPYEYQTLFVRLLSNGNFDSTFNEDGFLYLDTCGYSYSVKNILQVDQKLLSTYLSECTPRNGIFRIDAFGNIDSTFNEDGFVFFEQVAPTTIALQADQKIIFAGNGIEEVFYYDLVLGRLLNDHQPCFYAPADLYSDFITSNKAKLHWNDDAGAIKYKLQFRKLGTTLWSTLNVTTNFKTILGLIPNTTYQYRVRSLCPDVAPSPWSEIETFTTLPLRIGEQSIENENLINLFPNPNNGNFNIALSEKFMQQNLLIRIINLYGEAIYTNEFYVNDLNLQIHLSEFISNGIYVVEINCPNQIGYDQLNVIH